MQQGRRGGDVDDSIHLTGLQGDVDFAALLDIDEDIFLGGRGESGVADGDLVVADLDGREDVDAARVGFALEHEAVVGVGEGDLGVGNGGAGVVLNGAGDGALIDLSVPDGGEACHKDQA